jgi:ABC-type Na+ efflux pump permease subunit
MLSVINKFDANKIILLEEQLSEQRERYVELMQMNVRLQEKASEAIAQAREAKAVSTGTAREVDASLTSIRSEVNSQINAVNDKMKALQKATTNPLGR